MTKLLRVAHAHRRLWTSQTLRRNELHLKLFRFRGEGPLLCVVYPTQKTLGQKVLDHLDFVRRRTVGYVAPPGPSSVPAPAPARSSGGPFGLGSAGFLFYSRDRRMKHTTGTGGSGSDVTVRLWSTVKFDNFT